MKKLEIGQIHFIQVCLFVILVVLTVIAILPIQKKIDQQLAMLKSEFMASLEDITNRGITYESLSPSIFRFLEVRELSIFDKAAPENKILSIRRLKIYYRLRALLSGMFNEAVKEISVENSSIHIDMERDEDILTLIQDIIQAGDGSNGGVKAPDIRFSGKNLSISIAFPEGEVHLEKLYFSFSPSSNQLTGRGRLSFSASDSLFGFTSAQTRFSLKGSFTEDFLHATLNLKLHTFDSNMFRLKKQSFAITLAEGSWSVTKIQDKSPIDLKLVYEVDTGTLDLSFNSENFNPSDLVIPGSDLSMIRPWLSSQISGRANLFYTFDSGALVYSTDLNLLLDNRFLPAPLKVRALLAGDNRWMNIQDLKIRSPLGNLKFAGDLNMQSFIPSGRLHIWDIPYRPDALLSGSMIIRRDGNRALVSVADFSAGGTDLNEISMIIEKGRDALDFSFSGMLFDSPGENLIEGDGFLQLKPDLFLQASVAAKNIPVADAVEIFTGESRVPGLKLSGEAFISTDFERVSFASPRIEITSTENRENQLTLAFSGTRDGITVKDLSLFWNGFTAEGDFSSEFGEKGSLAFSTDFMVQEIPYNIQGMYYPGTGILLSGLYNFRGEMSFDGEGGVRGRLFAEDMPIPFREMQANLDITASYKNASSWEVSFRDTGVKGLPIGQRLHTLVLTGNFTPDGGTIQKIHLANELTELIGNGQIRTLISSRHRDISGWIQLESTSSDEAYSVIMDINGSQLDGRIEIIDSPLKRFGELPLSGLVSSSVIIEGSLSSPLITADFDLPSGRLIQDPINLSGTAIYQDGVLNLSNIHGKYLSSTLTATSLSTDFRKGELLLSGLFSGRFDEKKLAANFSARGEFIPEIFESGGIPDFNGVFDLNKIYVDNSPVDPWNMTFKGKEGKLSFHGGPQESIIGSLNEKGSFTVTLKDPLPLSCEIEGRLEGTNIEAAVNDIDLDFMVLDTLIKIPFFRIKEGHGTGNLRITGQINDPDIWGIVKATDVYAETDISPDRLGPFRTDLQFQGKRFFMEDVDIPIDQGMVRGDIYFTLDHWVPKDVDIALHVYGHQGLYIEYIFADVEVYGWVKGDFTIKADQFSTILGGDLIAHDTSIAIGRQAEVMVKPDKNLPDLMVDLNIASAQNVEFVWPSRTLPILRSFADTGQEVSIIYDGSSYTFSLTGDISIRGGQIYYFKRNFYIREGLISFNEDQTKFDPVLTARAEIREISTSGEDIKISLIVDGDPFSRFSPRFVSSPPMSGSEIVSLLGASILSQEGDLSLGSAIMLTSDIVGQFGVIQTFEERIKDLLHLDLFSIRTQMLSNVLLEKVLEPERGEGVENSSIGRYLDNTTLFLGKYFGEDLFLEALIQISTENRLPGSGLGEGLLVDSEVSLEWKTPLFLLELSVLPDFTDLFSSITNTSLGFSWEFSY
ncbi:MAG: translocation/assembly module TamB domain-containing protein [Spirochaetales bacterium]|nr:translocation/assembly module TamB domain-containing protein [Spirochaetales bacterium]